ncbi:hypothetical protein R3P38DRAFT_2556497 [Favolaschia claudopus]|uniref:DNA endonuclease activator Ctp1 C-terminal domain-containing protein n=1 Tax=Favolaschia claudopus TaxID=2862362 RepID=A0AAW0AAE9_9AGAR
MLLEADCSEDPQLAGETPKERSLQQKLTIALARIDGLQTRLSEVEQEGTTLAKSLGFDTVSSAQLYVDLAATDDPTPYKARSVLTERLQTDLSVSHKENEVLRAQMRGMQTDIDTLKAKATHLRRTQVPDLQRRFDELRETKQRAEEMYKADYRKFKDLKTYCRSPEIQLMKNQLKADFPNLTEEEKTRRNYELAALLRQKTDELYGADNLKDELHHDIRAFSPTDDEDVAVQSDKENQSTPIPQVRRPRKSASPLLPIAPVFSQSTTPIHPIPMHVAVTSASQTLVANSRVSPHFRKGNSKTPVPPPTGAILIPNSSDTEDPDPGPIPPLQVTPIAAVTVVSASISSSDTEDDMSQDLFPLLIKPPVAIKEPPRSRNNLATQSKTPVTQTMNLSALYEASTSKQIHQRSDRHSDVGVSSSQSRVATEQRPAKKRRISSPGPSSSLTGHVAVGELGASAQTPLYVSGDTPSPSKPQSSNTDASTARKPKSVLHDTGKGKQKELLKTAIKTPVNYRASSSKQPVDYSVYKGRGRYANDTPRGNESINAQFAIDPAQNGGRDFQFDEVVRGRVNRQHMEGGDCECCRDYYEHVGPMPPRQEAPPWRSPSGSPRGLSPCSHTETGKQKAAIASHRNKISRHKHNWAPTSTPPSYWNIGFPDTQEVASINEKAREMHEQKQKAVQEEADKNHGRYRRR